MVICIKIFISRHMVPKFLSKIPVGYLKSSETQDHLNIFKIDPFSTVILSFLKRERDCLTSLTALEIQSFSALKKDTNGRKRP